MYEWLVGLKKEAHKKMPRIVEQRWEHQIFYLLQCGGWRKNESRAKALVIHLMDVENKKAFLFKRTLKGDKIYLDDDLTPTKVVYHKENMPRVIDTRNEEKWVLYRDGKVFRTKKRATILSPCCA